MVQIIWLAGANLANVSRDKRARTVSLDFGFSGHQDTCLGSQQRMMARNSLS